MLVGLEDLILEHPVPRLSIRGQGAGVDADRPNICRVDVLQVGGDLAGHLTGGPDDGLG